MSTDALRLATPSAVAAVADVACAHCGLAVPNRLVDEAAERQFCCTGCHTAFAFLHVHGLDRYYGFAERREAPVRATGRSYEEFDHPAFAQLYVQARPNGLARTELYLEGVHCASCVWLVERVPLLQQGVARAELDVRRSLAVIEWDPTAVPLSAIARALDTRGYPPHPFRGVARADMRRKEDRAMLVRIGIATEKWTEDVGVYDPHDKTIQSATVALPVADSELPPTSSAPVLHEGQGNGGTT